MLAGRKVDMMKKCRYFLVIHIFSMKLEAATNNLTESEGKKMEV